MVHEALFRRAEDLKSQCARQGVVTRTGFLTPAECHALTHARFGDGLLLHGGGAGCQRKIAFFLPDYLSPEDFAPGDYIAAFSAVSKFERPGHRDYLGAILGLGLERRCLGDIFVTDNTAGFFCLPSVAEHIAQNLKQVGRAGVSLTRIPPETLTVPEIETEIRRFTLQSLRLDSVTAALFRLSRADAAGLIRSGLVQLNYSVCEKPDQPVRPDDILSARGYGKAQIMESLGQSRKGRVVVTAELYQ